MNLMSARCDRGRKLSSPRTLRGCFSCLSPQDTVNSVHACACVHMYVSICMYIYYSNIHICAYIHTSPFLLAFWLSSDPCTNACLYIQHVCVHAYTHTQHVRMYVYIRVHVCVCVCVYVYVHTFVLKSLPRRDRKCTTCTGRACMCYACTYACMYMWLYVTIYIYVYTHKRLCIEVDKQMPQYSVAHQ